MITILVRPDNHYDTYLSIGVVEHRLEGPEPFLSEAYRVLKPGGKIAVSVPYLGPVRMLKSRLSLYDRKRPGLPFFQYGFTREEFVNFLQKAGFVIEEVGALYAHRLLLEEIDFYRWALSKPGGYVSFFCTQERGESMKAKKNKRERSAQMRAS